MNLNSTSFQHKLPPLFQNQEEAQKKPKPFNNLNLNSSEFKNLEDKEKINSVFIDPTQQKQTLSFTLPSQEKMNDTKKKLSLKSSSKPFTMNFGDIHQESPTNKTNAKEVDSPQTKPQIQIQPQTVILDPKPIEHQPLGILNFSQMNSSSYPKLSNKKNPKITVSATNSSNNLVEKLQKSDLNLEILHKNNDISQKEQETVEETSEKGLPPILEESHVKEDVQQGDSQLFRNYAIKEIPSSTSSQKKNDLNFKEISSATQMRKVEGLSKSPEKTNEKAIQRQVEQEVKLEINAKKEENKLESPTNGPIPLIQSKVELTPETCYKEFMLSIIEVSSLKILIEI